MNKTYIIALLLLMTVVAFGCSANETVTPVLMTQSGPVSSVEFGSDLPTVTSEEVAKHDYFGDCWIVYNNKVFDVTLEIATFPDEGKEFYTICGSTLTGDFEYTYLKHYGNVETEVSERFGDFMGYLVK